MRTLADRFADRPVLVDELVFATEGRGFDLLLLVIALPFLTPIPLLGLSTPFGLVILLIGARLALGQRPWLPATLRRREIPPRFITGVLKAASRIVRGLEFLLRPRLAFLHEQFLFRRLAGVLIMISGFLLLLPLPVPFTNTFPALTVVLIAAGALERDGLCFLGGCVAFLMTAAYFALIAFGGAHAIENLWRPLRGS